MIYLTILLNLATICNTPDNPDATNACVQLEKVCMTANDDINEALTCDQFIN